jgi:hypothetical protein
MTKELQSYVKSVTSRALPICIRCGESLFAYLWGFTALVISLAIVTMRWAITPPITGGMRKTIIS